MGLSDDDHAPARIRFEGGRDRRLPAAFGARRDTVRDGKIFVNNRQVGTVTDEEITLGDTRYDIHIGRNGEAGCADPPLVTVRSGGELRLQTPEDAHRGCADGFMEKWFAKRLVGYLLWREELLARVERINAGEPAEDRTMRWAPLLNDISVLKQVEAMLVISDIGPPALPAVARALKQIDPTAGIAAVLRMGADALPLLGEVTALLKRRNPTFVRNACHILASWGPAASPALPALKKKVKQSAPSGKLYKAALHAVEAVSKGDDGKDGKKVE